MSTSSIDHTVQFLDQSDLKLNTAIHQDSTEAENFYYNADQLYNKLPFF